MDFEESLFNMAMSMKNGTYEKPTKDELKDLITEALDEYKRNKLPALLAIWK